MAIRRRQRFVEEDPYTDQLTAVAGTSLVVHRSRFEVDMNRARERAVYRTPGDAWGPPVWRGGGGAGAVAGGGAAAVTAALRPLLRRPVGGAGPSRRRRAAVRAPRPPQLQPPAGRAGCAPGRPGRQP